MDETLGTGLPRRNLLTWVWLVVGAIGVAITAMTGAAALAAGGGTRFTLLGVTLVLGLLVALCPFWAASYFARYRVHVSDSAITLTVGGRVRRRVAWTEADEVRVRQEAWVGLAGGPAVYVFARPDSAGRRIGIWAPTLLFTDLAPLVSALAPVVARRPDLLRSEESRDRYADLTGLHPSD